MWLKMKNKANTHTLLSFYKRHLSLRLSVRVVAAMNILLMATLLVMFFVSRRSMKADALNRASQTLEGAMVKVDNILLSVEETMGNLYFHMQPQLHNPDSVKVYCQKIVETNPYVTGCTIAFKPDFNPACQELTADSSKQVWYSRAMEARVPLWMNPMDSTAQEPLIAFCMPLPGDDGMPVGVMRADVSLSHLSGVIAMTKPTPNSYCALLDRDGSFIVHPTGEQLMMQNAFSLPGEALHEVVQSVMSGESGYMPLSLAGRDFYVFYKPFEQAVVPNRAMTKLGWSIAVAMSKEDIFGEFYRLFNYVVVIAFGGLAMLLLLCWVILHLRLRPLKMLTEKAERIAEGHYDEPIPKTWNRDEIGSLQRNFIRMRRALAAEIGELEDLTETIQERSEELKTAYKQAKKADKMKTAFLHHMTNQMVTPAQAIDQDVTTLCAIDSQVDKANTMQLVDDIQQHGNAITLLLNQLLNQSEEDMRKEVEHE